MPRFDDCCNQEETVQFDCPCTKVIPNALPSVSVTFDLNTLINQRVSFEKSVSFQCCDGDLTLAVSPNEHPVPLGYTISPVNPSTTDGTYDFDVNFLYEEAYDYEVGSGSFTIYYVLCGKEIPLIVNYTYINSCIAVYPAFTSPIVKEWTTADDGASYNFDVDFESIECCSIPTDVEITAVVTTGTDVGVTYIGFPVGYGFSGQGTINVSFLYTENGSTGYQTITISFSVCKLTFTQVVTFHVVAP